MTIIMHTYRLNKLFLFFMWHFISAFYYFIISTVYQKLNKQLRNKMLRRWRQDDIPRTSIVSLDKTIRLAVSSRFTEKKTNSSFVSACKVVRNGSWMEITFFIFGCFLAVVNGICGWPVLFYFTASFAQDISDILINVRLNSQKLINATNGSFMMDLQKYNFSTETEWKNAITNFTIPLIITGMFVLISGYLCFLILNSTAEKIVLRLKKLYFKKLLHQNMNWFNTKTQGELISTISKSSGLVQTALGDKLGIFISSTSNVTICLITCLWSGWKLTLAMSFVYPILIAISKLSSKLLEKNEKIIKILNGDLTGLLQEVIGAVRTVFAFGGEQVEVNRFTNRLYVSRKINIKQGVLNGLNFSLVVPIMQCGIAFGVWYGIKLMLYADDLESQYNVRHVFLIVFMILMSGIFVRQAAYLTVVFNVGFSAASDIINVIEKKQDIDNSISTGKILHELSGNINFNKVCFQFQSTDEKAVLKGLSLNVKAGEIVALVGPSGGGKSTILQLILRFYDPQEGEISIDGIPLKEMNIGWFRTKIGIVNQEPHLFNTTIKENIKYGKENASEEEIIAVAKAVDAHNFILKLPQQYDTVVGEQGSLLSVGQKQRIAIARALIKNPAILLLDEATSALDNESETKILDFLTKADCGRTVITIAHRLSTVRTVDRIIGIKDGRVVEQGTPHELIEAKGLYYQLLQVLEDKDPVDEVNTQNERRRLSKQQHNFLTNDYHQVINNDNTEKDSNDLSANKSPLYRLFRAIVELCRNDVLIFVGIVFMSTLYVCCLLARPFIAANLLNLIIEKSYYGHDRGFSFWAGLFLLTAICTSSSFIIKLLMQSIAEENLLLRIQQRSLAEILRQEVGWFDEPAHNIGNLCSLMMIDAENVKKIPGAIFGSWVFTSLAFTVMIIFGLWFQWKLALAIGVMNIAFFFSYYTKEKLDRQILLQRDTADTRANNLAIEAIRNVPTVVSQHIQHLISDKYNKLLGATNGYGNMLIHKRALAVASADAFCFLGLTIATSYGGYLMSCNELNYIGFQTINSLLINNMWEVIIAFSSIPSFGKACTSAIRLVELFDRKPLNDSSESAGIQLSTAIRPKIEFCDVGFSYPTTPTDKILNHFNLVIDRGEVVAFVGASGCGKTTCVQLLQRFYDPIDGKVTVNGYDVRSFNISFLRSLIGYVPQEPVLFSRSIGENVAYGNNERKVEIYEIIEAAKTANIHEFITSLQQGYDTLIGARGVELSGGQKQRVAIARALVKKSKILLLDEATSALDNDSEKAVQQSLGKVMKDRTCIIVAHRLSTIQNADKIVVFSQGKIVEIGSPQQLLAKKGTYYELLHAQSHKE